MQAKIQIKQNSDRKVRLNLRPLNDNLNVSSPSLPTINLSIFFHRNLMMKLLKVILTRMMMTMRAKMKSSNPPILKKRTRMMLKVKVNLSLVILMLLNKGDQKE